MRKSTAFLMLITLLYARENPFEPTQTFLEKKQELLSIEKEAHLVQEDSNLTDSTENSLDEQPLIESNMVDEEPAQIIQQEIMVQQSSEKFALKDGCKENYSFLLTPFVAIEIHIDRILIKIDKKYPLINQDIHKEIQKFVFDFKSKESFYTQKEKICNSYFDNVVVGSHDKNGFFRVAVKTAFKIDNYEEHINTNDNTIIIKIVDLKN
ncbi:MAG: hypothetical protein IE909_01170 [Campylobacterales bacterium]|nr:hypothetical protein [Campylobacterales bacterium]